MARRRRPEAPPLDDTVPDWLWEFDGRQWGWHSKDVREAFRTGRSIDGQHAAKVKWGEACDAWLDERGLVAPGHCNVSYQEFKRIEREEPHRVRRRPQRPE